MKPGDFHVGVISFFAILVPGAVITAVLEPLAGQRIFGPLVTQPPDIPAKWAAFLVAAYFIGHLIFLIGSYIDILYGWIVMIFKPSKNQIAFEYAQKIRDGMVSDNKAAATNPFQWSRAMLTVLSPAAAGEVHALEADSKFFRSLIVVFTLCAIIFACQERYTEGWFVLLLALMCSFRYYQLRLKSTTQAYIYLVALHQLGKLQKAPAAKSAAKNDTTQNTTVEE